VNSMMMLNPIRQNLVVVIQYKLSFIFINRVTRPRPRKILVAEHCGTRKERDDYWSSRGRTETPEEVFGFAMLGAPDGSP